MRKSVVQWIQVRVGKSLGGWKWLMCSITQHYD